MMKRLLRLALPALLILIPAPPAYHAQTTKWEDVPKRKGLQVGYNKYEDRTTVMTKRMVVKGAVGKGSFLDPGANQRTMEIATAFVHEGEKPSKPITEVGFIIMPKASTGFGKVFQGLEKSDDKERFYIAPGSKLIVIADGERFDLGEVSKSGTLNVWGDYAGNAFVAIPVDTFRKIAKAKKVEMAVGSIEIKLQSRDVERLSNLVDELDARKLSVTR